MSNILSFEVASNTGRAKAEIISLLNETKSKASEAARGFNELRNASIDSSAAASAQSNKIKELQTNLSRVAAQYQETRNQIAFHTKELKEENRAVTELQTKLTELKQAQAALAAGGVNSKQANDLRTSEKALVGAIDDTNAKIKEREAALRTLTTREDAEITAKKLLVQGIINEKEQLNVLTTAQQANNREKQKSSQTNQALEKEIRQLKAQLRELETQERQNQRQTQQLTAAQIAAATVVGNALYNAFRRLLSAGSDFIKDAVIYAARTDEMKIAMLGMAEASGNSRGELLAQEESIRRLNITTQEARQTLVKFQLAQLDVTKAATLARGAQDLAVIAGAETGEEVDRLVHGITTLQTRVLRTAGVNITLIESYKKVALETGRSVASFSAEEKQAIALNAVIDYASRATGLYGLSLDNAGKRMRSMTRLFQEMQNAIGGMLQGPFGNLVDSLSGLLKLIAAAPKLFAAFIVVMAGFSIQLIRNIAATGGWTAQLGILVKGLIQATQATLGLTAATATNVVAVEASGAAAAVSASRWATMGTAMGGILKSAGYIAVALMALNLVLQQTSELSKAFGGTTTLNGDNQSLEDVTKLRKEYKEVNDELERRIALGQSDKQGNVAGVRGYLERTAKAGPAGFLGIDKLGSYDQWFSKDLAERQQELQDALDKTNAKLGIGKTAAQEISAAQREYDEQLEKGGKANLDFSDTTEFVTGRLQMLKGQFEALGNPVNKLTGLTLTAAERLNVLKPEILALDTGFQKASSSQEEYNEKIADAERQFPGFTAALAKLRGESDKYIEGVGERAGEASRHILDMQKRLTTLAREIKGFFGVDSGGREAEIANLELWEKRLQIVRQEQDAINSARINLNRDVGAPIPTDREARLSLQNTYDTAIKVRDEIRAAARANKDFIMDVVKAQQLASTARTDAISAELTAAKMIADNQVKRVQDERQLTAEIIALSKQRIEQANDEAGTQKQAFGLFYKEQLDNLVKTEDATRRLRAEVAFNQNTGAGGLSIPEFGKINTALENIALPAATQAENIATITDQVTQINDKMNNAAPAASFEEAVRTGNPNYIGMRGLPVESAGQVGRPEDKALWDALYARSRQNMAASSRTMNPSQVAGVLKAAGWPSNMIPLMTAISQAESGDKSGSNPRAYNPIGDDQSYGLLQINMKGALGPKRRAAYGLNSNEDLFDPLTNAKIGLDIYKNGGGLRNWGAFTDGRYRQYMGADGGYNFNEKVSSPAYVTPKQTGAEYIASLSPRQLASLLRKNAVEQDKLNSQVQRGYTGSNESLIRSANLRIGTGADELEQFKKNQDDIKLLRDRDNKDFYNSEDYKKRISVAGELARSKARHTTHDSLLALIDEESKRGTEAAVRRASEIEASEVRARTAYNDSRDSLQNILDDQSNRQNNYQRYLDIIHNNGEASRLKISQTSEDAYNQMVDETNSHWRDSMEFRLAQWRNFETSRYEEAKKAQDELDSLDDQIRHATDLDPQKIEIERRKAVLEEAQADGNAKASMAANAERLANAQIYHADRANAQVMEYLAKQKSVDDIVADARINTMEAVFGAIDAGLSKITSKLGIFGDIVKEIISGFAKMALSKVFMTLFGLSPAGSTTQQSKGGGITSIFQGLIGGFGANNGASGSMIFGQGPGGTPTFSGGPVMGNDGIVRNIQRVISGGNAPAGSKSTQGITGLFSDYGQGGLTLPPEAGRVGAWGQLGNIPGGVQSGLAVALAGKTGLARGLGSSLAPMLPFLGAGLGSKLGGGGFGSILGGAGGLLLGGAGAFGLAGLLGTGTALAGTTGTVFGAGGFLGTALGTGGAGAGAGSLASLGAFFTNPITIGVGVALIAAAIIIGKNKKRRAAEKQRDKLMTDSLGALNQLLNQVRRDKIGVDEALAQAATIRAQYVTNVQSLPDNKTKNIAMKDVSRLDAIIQQIKIAGVAQSKRQELDSQLVPEFAGGGYVSSGHGGIIPGLDLGYDSVPALLRPNEVVLNVQQQHALGGHAAMARAGVPGFVRTAAMQARKYANGGYSTPTPVSTNRGYSGGDGNMNIYLVTDKKFAEDMAVEGKDKIVSLGAADIRDKGKIYAAVRSI